MEVLAMKLDEESPGKHSFGDASDSIGGSSTEKSLSTGEYFSPKSCTWI